jgi:hypothetical protein
MAEFFFFFLILSERMEAESPQPQPRHGRPGARSSAGVNQPHTSRGVHTAAPAPGRSRQSRRPAVNIVEDEIVVDAIFSAHSGQVNLNCTGGPTKFAAAGLFIIQVILGLIHFTKSLLFSFLVPALVLVHVFCLTAIIIVVQRATIKYYASQFFFFRFFVSLLSPVVLCVSLLSLSLSRGLFHIYTTFLLTHPEAMADLPYQ